MRRKSTTSEMMRSYIIESLLILLKDNNFSDITIGEITNKAGVNRSTYYRHFNSKEDIIFHYFDSILTEYLSNIDNELLSSKSYLENMFTSFLKHKDNILLLYKNNLYVILLDVLNKHFQPIITKTTKLQAQYMISYHIGGIFNHLLLWFSRGMEDPPSDLAEVSVSMLPEGFSPYLLNHMKE